MIAFYDTECYPNFWLLKFRVHDETRSFALHSGQKFHPFEDVAIISGLFADYTCVSFNGNHYDVPMISAALAGYTCEQLKERNDQIIVDGVKPWHLADNDWKPTDHIDIMEVLPGMGSQKVYAGRIHCKTMRDLPYPPTEALTPAQMAEVDEYCGNDLSVLESLFNALAPQLQQREELSKRYGIDLRSKSDAQLAEAVLKHRCEQVMGRRLYKGEPDLSFTFRYEPPSWVSFNTPQLQQVLRTVQRAVFSLSAKGTVEMPASLAGLEIAIGGSVYRMGIGGLHSSEKTRAVHSSDTHVLIDADVASYYPSLILNSGKWPRALGQAFLQEYAAIKDERLAAKRRQAGLSKGTPEWTRAQVDNEGMKIMINGTFGKTGSPYSILFAPEMMIQTTVTGQLALLMLIEWLDTDQIPVVSANTDGIVIHCGRHRKAGVDLQIDLWQRITGLEMETSEYKSIYSRDVNNYFAVKPSGEVKRKGEYSQAGLIAKKNPDVEICGDAVAAFLATGQSIEDTIRVCRDIRKFVVVQKVTGGAVKLWGDGPRKDALVRDMVPTLTTHGWYKEGRKWLHEGKPGATYSAHDAYLSCFHPQLPEYIGKVIRFYHSTAAPGPIVCNKNGNTVGDSWGTMPLMTLPDEFPTDVDYDWYIDRCKRILEEIAYVNTKAMHSLPTEPAIGAR